MAAMIDERTRAALSRLTENERACLARRLRHQTAKEMAIDLGISPHAVEKRLKMARTKLGVSSSLEAARLLEANERYGRTGPQPSDLGGQDGERQDQGDPKPAWRRIALYVVTGVIAMSLAVIALFAVAPLNAPVGGVAPLPAEGGVAPLPAEGAAAQAQSSYLVQLLLKQGDNPIGSPKLTVAADRPGRATATGANGTRYDIAVSVMEREGATYLVKMDLNSSAANGRSVRVTPAVLVKAGEPTGITIGSAEEPVNLTVVVTPANGTATQAESSNRYPVIGSTITTLKAYNEKTGKTSKPPQMVKAPAETVRAFVNESFDIQDKNHSGYLERDEAPASFVQGTAIHSPMPKPGESPPFLDDNEPVVVMKGPAAQAAYLANMDKDADGKVSRDEYQAANFPRFMGWGVPSNWNGAPKVAAN